MGYFAIRRIFAMAWFWLVAFVLTATAVTLALVIGFGFPKGMKLVLVLSLAAALAVIITRAILRVALFLVIRANGGPFKTGDTVQILVGPYRHRTSQVYEEWREREQVKVDLGETAKEKVEDIFSHNELVKANKA